MAKLELECKILAGAESKAWLAEFTKQVDRLERLGGKAAASTVAETPEPAEAEDEDEGEDFAPPTKKRGRPPKAKTAGFDEEEEDEAEDEEESDAIEMAKLFDKPKKEKKVTLDMLNDAAMERAKKGGKKGRQEVLALLEEHFETKSLSEIDESDYPKCLKLLKG